MNTPLEKAIKINCSLEHAFATFVNQIDIWWPRTHRKFENSTLSLAPQVGGLFLEVSNEGQTAELGQVLLYDAPHQIIYTWFPGSIKLPTKVEIKFSHKNNFTLVEVTHSEADSQLGDVWPQRVVIFNKSWETILTCIKAHIENN